MNLSLVALRSTVQLLRRPSMLVTRKWPPQTSSSAFSLSSSLSEAKSDRVEEKLNEDDWFKKIVKPTSGEVASDDMSISSTHETILKRVSGDGPVIKKRFNELEGEEKRKYIVAYYEASKEQGERVPKQLTEKYMEVLMRSETYSHFRRSLQFLMKEDYYTEKREYRKKLLAERRKAMEESRLNAVPGEPPTNYPGHYTYIHRIDSQTFRTFYQSRVLSSIRNNDPSVVFDFRFISQHTRLERIKSLYRQFAEIISRNRESPVPFQMHFCNYERDTEFHTKFGNSLAIDRNMILDSPKNYLETFDRDRLVYLSSDAPKRMTRYDPNKTYIIGAMIDMNPGEFEYYSYAQAKKDRIAAERLPLEIYPDWKKSKKNLNIDKVFNILLNLKHGGNWEDSFRENLPGSSYFLKKKQQEKNTDDDF